MRALCRWHFQPGGGPEYCRACNEEGLPCARGEPGADGRLCPYREHALISRQEHEAWDVLLACQGQLRLAPSGHVIGIDMDAALRLGAARGYDLAVLSELLPAAEAGLVEALSADRKVELVEVLIAGRCRNRRRCFTANWSADGGLRAAHSIRQIAPSTPCVEA